MHKCVLLFKGRREKRVQFTGWLSVCRHSAGAVAASELRSEVCDVLFSWLKFEVMQSSATLCGVSFRLCL